MSRPAHKKEDDLMEAYKCALEAQSALSTSSAYLRRYRRYDPNGGLWDATSLMESAETPLAELIYRMENKL